LSCLTQFAYSLLCVMDDSESIEQDAEKEQQQQDADGTDDQTVSMVDVLNDEQQLQDDANAVLGACDDNVCTYSQVEHSRQLFILSYDN